MSRSITTIAPVHLEFFGTLEAIADAKAEIFLGRRAGRRRGDQRRHPAIRAAAARRAGRRRRADRRVRRAREGADARLVKVSLQAETSTVQARILGDDVTYKLGAPGRHVVDNSLAVLAAAQLLGADLALAALALAELEPPAGRGARVTLDVPGRHGAADRRELQRQPGLDARGARAARAGPMRGDRAGASRCSATCSSSARGRGAACGARRRGASPTRSISCSAAGPLMKSLWDALPSERRGGYAESSAALEPQVLGAIQRRRCRHGQGLARLAHGPDRQGAASAATRRASRTGATRLNRCSTGSPISPARSRSFNVFRYITFRTGGAMVTAALFVFLFGPWIIDQLRLRQGKGQPIREDGPQSHLVTKRGTPTMGGLMILLGRHGLDGAVGQSVQSLCLDRARRDARASALVGFYDDYLKVTKQTHAGFSGRLRLVIEALVAVGACWALIEPRAPAVRDVAGVSVLQGAGASISAGSSSCSAPSSSSAPATR